MAQTLFLNSLAGIAFLGLAYKAFTNTSHFDTLDYQLSRKAEMEEDK